MAASTTNPEGQRLWLLKVKKNPRARRVEAFVQWHDGRESAERMARLREHKPGAVLVSARELTEEEAEHYLAGDGLLLA